MSWVINIPVISTLHVPGPEAMNWTLSTQSPFWPKSMDRDHLVHLAEMLYFENEEWLSPIADWAYDKHDTYWVRFDPDGDVIQNLPTFEDKWS